MEAHRGIASGCSVTLCMPRVPQPRKSSAVFRIDFGMLEHRRVWFDDENYQQAQEKSDANHAPHWASRAARVACVA